MNVLFAEQVPKELASPDFNEDFFSVDIGKRRFALSDGASESFDSKTWAQLLTNRFIENPELSPDWLSTTTYGSFSAAKQ